MKNFIYNTFNHDPYHTHVKLLNLIKNNSSVLEVGSATGYFTQELLKKGCKVICVEKDSEAVKIARKKIKTEIINADVINLPKLKQKFDYILLADILEHLPDPEKILNNLKYFLKQQGRFIISVPNIANYSIRLNLIKGEFEYKDFGILDKTHIKFFTKNTIEKLINDCGLKIDFFDVVTGFDSLKLYAKTLGRITFRIKLLRKIEYTIAKKLPNLFALEFIYEAGKR